MIGRATTALAIIAILMAATTHAEETESEVPKAGWHATPFPIIFYTPETGVGFGGGAVVTRRGEGPGRASRPQVIPLALIYTTKNQSIVALSPEFYLRRGTWKMLVGAAYQNFPSEFYGVGNDTREEDKENYTIEDLQLGLFILPRLHSHLRGGLAYEVKKSNLLEKEEGGILDQGILPGSDGGVRSGMGPALDWDTRDNVFYPTRGGWHQVFAGIYRGELGSDFDYESYTLDLRHYFSVTPRHILAVQAYCKSQNGDIPFNDLGQLGSVMRGSYIGRHQDRFMALSQVEYRFPLPCRLSGVTFLAAGDVSDGPEAF